MRRGVKVSRRQKQGEQFEGNSSWQTTARQQDCFCYWFRSDDILLACFSTQLFSFSSSSSSFVDCNCKHDPLRCFPQWRQKFGMTKLCQQKRDWGKRAAPQHSDVAGNSVHTQTHRKEILRHTSHEMLQCLTSSYWNVTGCKANFHWWSWFVYRKRTKFWVKRNRKGIACIVETLGQPDNYYDRMYYLKLSYKINTLLLFMFTIKITVSYLTQWDDLNLIRTQ